MRLLIMGPQGVGKGTQAALLAEHFNIPTISTGDIFRYNIKNKTELGLEAMSYTDKGELVPDSLTNKIVKDRLAKEDCKNGWILDGYPRNAAQVTALDEMLADLDTPLDHVVALEAARDVLLERMKKRAAEQGRADDTPEAIAKRLETYEKETAPLLDIYEARGLLVVVNGVGHRRDQRPYHQPPRVVGSAARATSRSDAEISHQRFHTPVRHAECSYRGMCVYS